MNEDEGHVTRRRMTEEEYLEYDRTHAGKREYFGGEMLDMAGSSEAHSLIVTNFTLALGQRLRGRPCRVHGSDLRVRVDETGEYAYPDSSVVCGRPEFAPTNPESLLNPSLLVEVLSPSTLRHDLGDKLERYRRRPSVRAVLLAWQGERRVTLYARNANDSWTVTDHLRGSIFVPHLEIDLSMDELYDGLPEAWARAAERDATRASEQSSGQ